MRYSILLVTVTVCLILPSASGYVEVQELGSLNSTHQFLFDQARGILRSDNHSGLADLLEGSCLNQMKRGSMRADETLFDSREHYMNPNTHEGFLGFKSAGQLATERFTIAVQNWNYGKRMQACFELGWSVHLVQDLTVPHHAALTPLDYHSDYESWVLQHQLEFSVVDKGTYEFDSTLEGHYSDIMSPFDWVDYNAHYSIQYLGYVNHDDPGDWRVAANTLLPRAQRTTAGYIYMFFQNVDSSPPIARAGEDRIARPGMTLSFDASLSSDDLGIESLVWEFGGERFEQRSISLTFGSEGVFRLNLTARDLVGKESYDSAEVLVQNTTMPIANAGSDFHVEVGEEFSLDGSNSSDEVGITSYLWHLNDAVIAETAIANYTLNWPGTYVFSLTVYDADGLNSTDSVAVVVQDLDPPRIIVNPTMEARMGEVLHFTANDSYDNVGIKDAMWYFGDGIWEHGLNVTHNYTSEGKYTVVLILQDYGGNTNESVISVSVLPHSGDDSKSRDPFVWMILFLALAVIAIFTALFAVKRWKDKK